jgi:protein-disulfide isomerase-like protein with CxxC motif
MCRWTQSRVYKGGMHSSPDTLRETFETQLRATVAQRDKALLKEIGAQFTSEKEADVFMQRVSLPTMIT